MKDVLQPALVLLLIIPVIFFTIFLLRKLLNKAITGNTSINIINQLTVGSKEKILHIEVEGTSLLIGVTAQQITKLHSFQQESIYAAELKPSLGSKINA